MRAMSSSSYEDGGLESVFRATSRFSCWHDALLQRFLPFLIKHVSFDNDPNTGHGALTRHLSPDETILRLWAEFYNLLVAAVDRGDKFNTPGDRVNHHS
jgi:hypothetical protein